MTQMYQALTASNLVVFNTLLKALRLAALLAAALLLAAPALAQTPEAFKAANPHEGEALVKERQCDACHAQKWGNDGRDIYRPGKLIHDVAQLRKQVGQCNTGLNLNLFPEEETDIAAWLNQSYYHFK
ncbi:hypothetical protein [Comamonas sp. NLF-1-9]|uniref:hypothetical protein n=1 Tax=Comamonas sp. NLF-1-9 TaxID=2853163 RepID=UPI001C4697C7|nr:hypothetical protein [Comamonas sp. NLF-1-9]QXL84835.1 hypothetical protein KUD94_02235 [Comamonas sp. NLF-1-9]